MYSDLSDLKTNLPCIVCKDYSNLKGETQVIFKKPCLEKVMITKGETKVSSPGVE